MHVLCLGIFPTLIVYTFCKIESTKDVLKCYTLFYKLANLLFLQSKLKILWIAAFLYFILMTWAIFIKMGIQIMFEVINIFILTCFNKGDCLFYTNER